ncbi:MAG: DUF177 domain-containing protein [Deltaproteobacteria bacterium]|nr:DUF177 domain-containing protein [Deltaproteobacteria bacterium]
MIIDLRRILQTSQRYEFECQEEWWQAEGDNDSIFALDGPLSVRVELYRAGDTFVLDGVIEGGVKVVCDRCLEPYHRDVKRVFKELLALPAPAGQEEELELADEDLDVDFIRGEEIELDDIIREQIYLSLPMKLVCAEGCRGLCPGCGVNLNRGSCRCPSETGHPGFSRLKDIKFHGS